MAANILPSGDTLLRRRCDGTPADGYHTPRRNVPLAVVTVPPFPALRGRYYATARLGFAAAFALAAPAADAGQLATLRCFCGMALSLDSSLPGAGTVVG